VKSTPGRGNRSLSDRDSLRDGEQEIGVVFMAQEKIEIADKPGSAVIVYKKVGAGP